MCVLLLLAAISPANCLQNPLQRITQAKVIYRKKVHREQLVNKQSREAENKKLVNTIKTMLSRQGE